MVVDSICSTQTSSDNMRWDVNMLGVRRERIDSITSKSQLNHFDTLGDVVNAKTDHINLMHSDVLEPT